MTAAKANRAAGVLEPTEAQIQISLLAECKLREQQHPELALIHSIPNEATYRNGRLRAMGVKPGVPDLHLPVARGGFHGLWLELKRPGEKPRPEQVYWHAALTAAGHRVVVCYTAETAMAEILAYLNLKPEEK